ncbi:MAG TPA: hypothetical protein VK731_09245, partial [Candidatus Cybelea sp.]|nr:hypothetical protein [Candidatus Cybelea sp.]
MVRNKHHPAWTLVRPILVVLLVCLVIGFAVVLARRIEADQRARFATLPDGRKLEFLGVAADGAQFTTDTGWKHIVRRFLPARFQNWLPVFTGRSDSNAVTVFLRRTIPSGAAGGSKPWDRFVAEDFQGFQYPGNGTSSQSYGANGGTFYGLTLPGFPRRQQQFLFRLLDKNGTALASFRVPNSLCGPFPDWRSLPLPQTLTNGPVALTLESVEKTTNRSQRLFLNPQFRLRAIHPAWMNARAEFQAPVDATGNEGHLVSPREPAWKLLARVNRDRSQDYSASEQWVLTNLPLPASGQFLPLDKSGECAGV